MENSNTHGYSDLASSIEAYVAELKELQRRDKELAASEACKALRRTGVMSESDPPTTKERIVTWD